MKRPPNEIARKIPNSNRIKVNGEIPSESSEGKNIQKCQN